MSGPARGCVGRTRISTLGASSNGAGLGFLDVRAPRKAPAV